MAQGRSDTAPVGHHVVQARPRDVLTSLPQTVELWKGQETGAGNRWYA